MRNLRKFKKFKKFENLKNFKNFKNFKNCTRGEIGRKIRLKVTVVLIAYYSGFT